jgi:hypothetical protein
MGQQERQCADINDRSANVWPVVPKCGAIAGADETGLPQPSTFEVVLAPDDRVAALPKN